MADLNDIIEVFCGIDEPKTMRGLFDEIFTERERHDLALRWELMRMLHENIPQRDIAAELGISLCKITRGAKILKAPNSVCRGILESNE